MSGSIMSGGGVDSSIPLRAGQGVPNPLQSVGQTVDTLRGINDLKLFPGQMTLQQQAIQGGAATLAQHLTQTGAAMLLPTLANPNFTMQDLTHGLGAVEGAGGTSHGVLGILGASPFAPDTPEWRTYVKQGVASLAQTDAQAAAAQTLGAPAEQQTANGIVAGVRQPAAAGGGFTPATATPMGIAPARATRPATEADVRANPSLTLGQPIQTVLPGESGGPAGAPTSAPAGSLGPGGYRAPQRPLNQLGAPYTPPGGAAPAAPAPPAPGAILMRGPKGQFWVTPDKVATFKAAGYQ